MNAYYTFNYIYRRLEIFVSKIFHQLNLNSANIYECPVWSQRAKFNARQYFQLYGAYIYMYCSIHLCLYIQVCIMYRLTHCIWKLCGIYHIAGIFRRWKLFVNFAVSGWFTTVLTKKIFVEYGSIISNGHVIFLDSVGSWMLPPSRLQSSICPTAASQTDT